MAIAVKCPCGTNILECEDKCRECGVSKQFAQVSEGFWETHRAMQGRAQYVPVDVFMRRHN